MAIPQKTDFLNYNKILKGIIFAKRSEEVYVIGRTEYPFAFQSLVTADSSALIGSLWCYREHFLSWFTHPVNGSILSYSCAETRKKENTHTQKLIKFGNLCVISLIQDNISIFCWLLPGDALSVMWSVLMDRHEERKNGRLVF